MLLTQSASHWRKCLSISLESQFFVPGINKYWITSKEWSNRGDKTFPPLEDGIQRCYQIWISFPSLILHLAPLEITSLTCMILFQAKKHLELRTALKMSPEGKYLMLNTLYNRVSFSWNRRLTTWKNIASPIKPNEFSEDSQHIPTKIFKSLPQYLLEVQ